MSTKPAAGHAGVSVAWVARRYAVNANLIFKWLRDARFALEAEAGSSSIGDASFPPVEIVQDTRELPVSPTAPAAEEGRIEIELGGGQRMRITGRYDPEALARLIRGLTA